MNKQIHHQIFQYIDQKISAQNPVKAQPSFDSTYKNIFFGNDKKSKKRIILFDNKEFGYLQLNSKHLLAAFSVPIDQFYRFIVINRFNNFNIPKKSYFHEVCYLFHEYGHFISLLKGNNLETEVKYDYHTLGNLQKSASVKEEINAWKYGFLTLYQIPLSLITKLYILYLMLPIMFRHLYN